MILNLASHYTESIVACVVVDVYSTEACGTTGWDPLLVGIIIYHDSGSCLADTLFTAAEKTQKRNLNMY